MRSFIVFCILLIIITSNLNLVEGKTIQDKKGGEGIAEGEDVDSDELSNDFFLGSKPSNFIEPIKNHISSSLMLMTTKNGLDIIENQLFLAPSSQMLQSSNSTLFSNINSTIFSRNLIITRDLGKLSFQTEPHLSVNPLNSNHLVLGVIDYNFPSVNSYVSTDGGENWNGPFQTRYLNGDIGSGGDPVVSFDNKNNVYIAYISLGIEDYRIGPFVGESYVSSIAVSKSLDGGKTWENPISSSRSMTETNTKYSSNDQFEGKIMHSFLDKPWLTIGPNKNNVDENVIYVTYTKFDVEYDLFYVHDVPMLINPVVYSSIELVSSFDYGQTWTEPVIVSPVVKQLFGYGTNEPQRVVQGSQPAVDQNGSLYVAWLDSTDDGAFNGLAEINIARSDDNGKSFILKNNAALLSEIGFRSRSLNFRSWGAIFPQIALGNNGEVYIVFTEKPPDKDSDDGDIYFVSSFDKGENWNNQQRINQDDTNRFQFFPSISTDVNGKIHLIWGDFSDDENEASYHIYYTVSENQGIDWGVEFENNEVKSYSSKVSDYPSNPNFAFPGGLFIGDYFSIQVTDNYVYVVWPDSRLGEYGSPNQKIAFARLRPISNPTILVDPTSGSSGSEIKITGSNFQSDKEFYVQLDNIIISSGKINEDGGFETKLFIPVSGAGSHSINVFDTYGNSALASFDVDFGFDTLQDKLFSSESQDSGDMNISSFDSLILLLFVLILIIMSVLIYFLKKNRN